MPDTLHFHIERHDDEDGLYYVVTGVEIALVTDAGNLEPCLMLDAAFWDKEAERRSSAVVAAAPARDVLMFSDRSVRGNVEILKKLTLDVHATADKEALSKTVYLWNRGRWEAFA